MVRSCCKLTDFNINFIFLVLLQNVETKNLRKTQNPELQKSRMTENLEKLKI